MTDARASKIVLAPLLAIAASCASAPPTERAVARPTETAHTVTIASTRAQPSLPPPRVSDRFAVAAENATAVEVARQTLERGGSATDAAVVGLLVGCAAHAASCGLGGGGVSLSWDPKAAKTIVVDFREVAPSGLKIANHLGKATTKQKRGVMVGVPGFVAGLAELHRHGGKLTFADDVGAAADAIENGVPVSPYMAQALAWDTKWIADDERARDLFGGGDPEARVGDTLKNPALVEALRKIAADGPDAFYTGELGADVVTTARAWNSRMVGADLTSYRAIVREPLTTDWAGVTLVTPPAPFAGGFVALETVGVLRPDDLSGEWGTAALIHTIAEAARLANQDRVTLVGDPRFTKADVEPLLDPRALTERRAKIRPDVSTMPKLPSIAEGGSFHLVVVDADGAIVTVTATVTSLFGSKIVTKSGFVLNDALTEFTMDDYGQRPATRGPNFARGGARPASSLAPVLVFDHGAPVLALGGSGGLRIPNAVAEVLALHVGMKKPIADAVAAPRFHVTPGGALKLDGAFAPIEAELEARGEVVQSAIPSFAAVTAIAIRKEGELRILDAVFDPRKGGAITVGHGTQSP